MDTEDLTLLPASRKLALKVGSEFYFTGVACKRQHLTKRYTKKGDCVSCARDRVLKWQKDFPERANAKSAKWYRENTEQVAVGNARWRAANPKKPRAYAAKYRNANSVAINQRQRERYAENPEAAIQRVLANAKANPARINATVNKRRATKLAADGFYLADDVLAIMERQDGFCIGCDKDITKQHAVDHYIPLARGGSNWPENLQLLCRSCNSKKTTLTMDEWLARRGGPDVPENARILWAMEIHRQINAVPPPIRERPTSGIAGMKWSTNDIECERRKTDVPLPDGWRWGRLPMPNRKRPAPGLKRKQKASPLPLLDNMEDAA